MSSSSTLRGAPCADAPACGAPSLRRCTRLAVRGDVTFGADNVVVGDVEIRAEGGPVHLADGTVLEG